MIFSLNKTVSFKKEIADKFPVQIHFHDSWSGQFFSLKKPTAELKEYIKAFFTKQNINVRFSENSKYFFLEEVL